MKSIVCTLLLIVCGTAAAERPADTAYGEVVIRTTGRHLFVLADTADRGKPGCVDEWFILEAEHDFEPALSVHLPAANLVHHAGSLRVTAPGQQMLYEFAVADHASGAAPEGFTVVRQTGFGLSRYVGVTDYGLCFGGAGCFAGDP